MALGGSCGCYGLLLRNCIKAVLARTERCVSACFVPGERGGVAGVAAPALVILPARIEDEGWVQDGHLHHDRTNGAIFKPESHQQVSGAQMHAAYIQ